MNINVPVTGASVPGTDERTTEPCMSPSRVCPFPKSCRTSGQRRRSSPGGRLLRAALGSSPQMVTSAFAEEAISKLVIKNAMKAVRI